ncbi:flagellar filament capping protein FliD [Alloalcanivorax xenomutans]|jgi:flagellar hook-associated protein 2|uniref:Flagellar hook-associated protein 2 n=1 Tax=Alloalcanivorax xenomutans TaxID=1094342 RepID=A0A9Q3W7I6_9GAMM|nr:flagellar filament capping protein FliD [Alloalcanivorax xenomutans]MCE7509974.1 flagellar filament capping protein FliD [Alloalcanivorax xenomutans]PHS69424.1 MAG: flagellar filament capping protein FliD [Alcanivorax sp.]
MASIASLGVGSGLDLNGLLEQLESAERQKLTPITNQAASYQAKISAFGTLESALDKFRDAAETLGEEDSFRSVATNQTGESVTFTTGTDVALGSFDINVTQRARAYSIATQGVADKDADLGAGSVSIDLANGESLEVTLSEDKSSLKDLRDAINDQNKGVQASIVNDGSGTPYRLVMTSAKTGTEEAISGVSFSGGLGSALSLDGASEVTARNAEFTINGIAMQSQSNKVEDAIQGVTLNLVEEGESSLDITRDTDAIKKAVNEFVSAFNNLKESIGSLTSFNSETGESGELIGNSTVRRIESELRGVLSAGVDEGEYRVLADLGVSLQRDGTLKVNDEDLDEAISNNLEGVSRFFVGRDENDGIIGKLDSALEDMLEDDGMIDRVTEGFETSIDSLSKRYDRMEQSIAATVERYRTQFQKLDSMVAQMNATSSYLTQQFDMLNAQLKQ